MKKFFALFSLFLTACAQQFVLPSDVPQWQTVRQFALVELSGETQQSSLLVVQPTADGQRWIQTNALGMPLARQILSAQGWQNDGFLPPNSAASALFSAILYWQTPAAERAAAYQGKTTAAYWQIEQHEQSAIIQLNGQQWQVTPIL